MPAAGVIVEAMCAIVLAGGALEKFGVDLTERAREEAKGNVNPAATTSVMKNSGTWIGQTRAELLLLSPSVLVPRLTHEGASVWDTLAIAEYLNELEQARRIAKQFGTNHHEVIISEKEMHEFLPQMVFHQDEPIADPVCVPLYYVSKLARDSGTIVVQVGEGSDEIFSGYENYVRHLRIYENFWRHAETLPLSLRRAISNLSRPALEATGRKRAAIELIRRLGANEPLFWGGVVVYDETFKPRVLSSQVRERLNGLSSLRVVESYLKHIENERPDADFLARMTYLELKLRLPELLLMRVDKITMATSVEARVPFLDYRLVELAQRHHDGTQRRRGDDRDREDCRRDGKRPDGAGKLAHRQS